MTMMLLNNLLHYHSEENLSIQTIEFDNDFSALLKLYDFADD